MSNRLRWGWLLLLLLCLPTWVHAATYYTRTTAQAPSASDSNSCPTATNTNTPKRTINGGVSCLSAGDTLIVGAGTYTDVVVWYYYGHQRSGTAGNPITVKSETYRGAIIQPGPAGMGQGLGGGRNIIGLENQSYWTFDGFVTDGTGMTEVLHVVAAQTANHITILNMEMRYGKCYTTGNNTTGITTDFGQDSWTIRGNYIHDMGTGAVAGQPFYSYGIYFTATNSLIENNEFAYESGHGMHMHNTQSSASGNIMRNNLIHHNGIPSGGNSPGVLWAAGGYNNEMYNNVIYANSGSGVRLGGAGSYGANNTVSFNTIVQNGTECIIVGAGYGNDNNKIQGNICNQNGTNQVVLNNSNNNTINNLLSSASPSTLFVNPGGGNFQLVVGSAAINAGPTGTGITTDYAGNARGAQPDAGAYEFGGGGPPPAPTALRFSQDTSTAGVGYPMQPAVTVRVLDQSGVLFPTASNPVTLALSTNPAGAILGGTLTAVPVGGIATFGTLTISQPSDGYVLTASATGLTADSSAPFTVVPGTPSTFYVSRPSGTPAGSDTRTCLTAQTLATPLATLAKGRTCLVVPGSTLLLRAGTYPETLDTLTQPIMSGTSWSTPTTIGAAPGETVTLQPTGAFGTPMIFVRNADAYLIFDRLRLDGTGSTYLNGFVAYPDTHHIRFQHGDIGQTYYEPVFLQGRSISVLDTTIHDIVVFDTAQKFPAVSVTAATDDITLDHLTIRTIWGTGIKMDIAAPGFVPVSLAWDPTTVVAGQTLTGYAVSRCDTPLAQGTCTCTPGALPGATTGPTTLTYDDNTVVPGQAYCYAVATVGTVDGVAATSALSASVKAIAPGTITNAHITNTILHHTGQDGVSPAIDLGQTAGDVTTSLLYAAAAGIRVRPGGGAVQVVNTTLSGITGTGIQIDAGAVGTLVENTIVASAGTSMTNAGTGTTFTTNLCSGGGIGCTFIAAPLFTNAGADNYTLLAGSPARNAGTPVVGLVLDLAGLLRPSGPLIDIGAYEYQETGAVTPRATALLFLQ